ncbi:unnamed protein product, partial [marine sediment metagenome]
MKDYFKTNREEGGVLVDSIKKARSQQELILNFLVAHPYQSFTPFDIKDRIFLNNTPITSIRRAIT